MSNAAEERLRQAREALLADGYFTPDQVGDDIAPRIIERLAAARKEAAPVRDRDAPAAASGHVVSRPPRKHQCTPGWTNYHDAGQDPLGSGPGWYSSPPDASDFPKGTVWQCACGQAWVSTGPPAGRSHGVVNWRRESRRARRRRERKASGAGT